MKKRGSPKYFVVLLFILFSITLITAIPNTFTLNGRLTDTSGDPMDGTYSISFKVYNASSGGTLLTSIAKSVTTDTNGVYYVTLDVANLSFDEDYYLGVKVESDSEMTPRINLTGSPYSFQSRNVTSTGIIFDNNLNLGSYNLTTLGRIGIGTTNPQNAFNVIGDGNFTGNLYVNGEQIGGSGSFVPYTGATANLDLGAYNFTTTGLGIFGNLNIDTLNFNANVISDSTGVISFDNDNITTSAYFIGDGSQLTNVNITGDYAQYQFGANSFSGSGNFTTTGNVTAAYFFGDGSQLSNVGSGNANYQFGANNFNGSGTFTTTGGIVTSNLEVSIILTSNINNIANDDVINIENRYLYANDGSDVILNWDTVGTAEFGDSIIQTTGTIVANGGSYYGSMGGTDGFGAYGYEPSTAAYGGLGGGSYGVYGVADGVSSIAGYFYDTNFAIAIGDTIGSGNGIDITGGGTSISADGNITTTGAVKTNDITTSSGNLTISSIGGSVIIKLG